MHGVTFLSVLALAAAAAQPFDYSALTLREVGARNTLVSPPPPPKKNYNKKHKVPLTGIGRLLT